MTTLREAAQQALEALKIGYDSAKAEADQYHAAMAGYRPQRHAEMDADVQKIAAAITALKAALVEDALQKFTEVNQELEAALAEPDLFHCPKCGGPADNGHDRSIPPSPYFCTKCMAEPVQEPVQQALVEADRIMGHDDEATEWRERWAHLFGVAGSATSPWRESAAQGCSLGGTGMPATPPQRPAEPMVWTTQFDINWALNNPGRAGSFYANKEGSNDIALYTTPPVCGRVTEPVQEPVAWRWGYRSVTTGEMDWRGYVEIAADPNLRSPAIIMEPLYTAPPQRRPLVDPAEYDDFGAAERYNRGLK